VPEEQTLPAAGGILTLKVNFTNFPSFNAWDISVKTNNAVLNPQSISIVETFGGTFSATTRCVNGSGLSCTGNDGAGVAHSAGFSLGASDAGNGTLFTITYSVVAGPATNVTYVTGTEDSSVSAPDGSTLVSCAATPNQCLTGSVSVVDFSVTANPTSIGPVGIGTPGSSTITVAPENGFIGTVDLAVSAPAGVTASLASPSVTITSGNQTDMLTASSSSGGTFGINVTGSISGFPSRKTTVTLKVTDFSVTAHPSTLSFVRGTNDISNITVTPINGFTGTVDLVASAPSGVTASLATLSVTITSGNKNDTLTVSSSTTGTYLVNVTGSSPGFPSHNTTLTVTVTGLSSSTSSTVINDGTGTTGSSYHDAAAVMGVTGTTPTGSLTYSFFTNGACSGTAKFTHTVSLSGSTVLNSNSTGPLASGSYAFQATYNGDVNYTASTSSCEAFSVAKAASTTATVVVLESGAALTPLVAAGSRVNDTAAVTGVTGFIATGTLVYNFYKNNACSVPSFSSQNVTMSNGRVPNSLRTSPLAAGSYSFNATYSGDANYFGSKSTCESFTVDDFSITANPASIGNIASGVSGSSIITVVAVNGFTGTVNLVVAPSIGLSASLNVSSVVLSSTVTSKAVLLVVNGTLGGAYPVVVNGTSSGFPFHNVLVSTTVLAPLIAAGTPTASATSVTIGDKVTVTVTLTDNSVGVPFTTTVWLKWGGVTVVQKNVTLTPGQSTQVSLVWDTSGYAAGSDSLSVSVPASGTTSSGPTLTLASAGSSLFSFGNPYLLVLLGVIVVIVVASSVLLLRRAGRRSASRSAPN